VQLLFSLGLQGLSIIFILWLQLGHGFSPLHAGLTLIAFSFGAVLTAPNAGKYAFKHGRNVLALGALLLAVGTALVAAPAWHMHGSLSSWIFTPGFVIAGAGLGLLVVPLVNVVLSAVPAELSGGASGVFSTAQQLGGAIGVATIGSVFFSKLTTGGYDNAFKVAVPFTIASYVLAGLFCLALPKKALSEEEALELA
jgi:MFS family permease